MSGGSGRGIRTTFAPQTLSAGQSLQASFTFSTPATIGKDRDSAIRVGIYDKLGRAELEGDQSASSKSPNTLYDELPGYMIDIVSATSLGGVETLIEHRHSVEPPETRVPENLLRLAVGIENPEDLWNHLEAALDSVTLTR